MKLRFLKRDLPKRPLAIAAALIAAASVVAGRERPSVEALPSRSSAAAASASLELDLGKLARPDPGAPQADPFAARSFAAPRAERAARPQPAAEAPPLPFNYAGKLTHDGRTEVFVLRGEELISIAAGGKIDAEYRVDSISDSSIGFTYLPLKTRQSLEIVEAGG